MKNDMNRTSGHLRLQTSHNSATDERFRSRMAAQICMIEDYRRQQARCGRRLSRDEAAREWIGRFAADFPKSIAA